MLRFVLLVRRSLFRFQRRLAIKVAMRGIDNSWVKRILDAFKAANATRTEQLTSGEVGSVKRLWGSNCPLNYYRLVKLTRGTVDPHFITDAIWFQKLLPRLNNFMESVVLEDKSIYGFYFDRFERPYEILRKIRGVFFTNDNKVISRAQAVSLLVSYQDRFIVKKTIDTEQGRGIRVEEVKAKNDVDALFDLYGDNFVCQELIKQSPETARLNQSSLNCICVTSLFLNGRFSVLSLSLKVGGKDNVVDNVGAGGYLVGIQHDGNLCDIGFSSSGRLIQQTYDGVLLKDCKISSVDRVIAFARQLHERMPYLPVIGWDIAIRENGQPVMIELNASHPGVLYEQLATGPLFGDRFDEVMEFVRANKIFRHNSGAPRPDRNRD